MLLLLSGSPHPGSANSRLLLAVAALADQPAVLADYVMDLPVYQPDRDQAPWPETVVRFRAAVAAAAAVVISTPAYLNNLPGVLKNALDWLTTSGELNAKKVLALTFTPSPPRGERARQSLLWSLGALNAHVVAETGLYQEEVGLTEDNGISNDDSRALLSAAVGLLTT